MRALGFSVTLYEQNNRLLHAASGNNQFRLHQGFHYPRHYTTRTQSREGFSRFIERYPALSRPVTENLYAVPEGDSLIDFATYRIIMTSSGIDFTELAETPPILAHIEGALKVSERVLLIGRARQHFAERLGDVVELGHRIDTIEEHGNKVWIDGRRFDFAVDATWGHYRKPPISLYYEPTLLLYYEGPATFPAVTMVDGPLCSVYPTEDSSIFTLSSVPHTPLGRFAGAAEARAALSTVDCAAVNAKRFQMERQISRYIPDFSGIFRFIGPQLSIKTKPTGAYDDRSCHVYREGRTFYVMSGKIDTIFFAVERILSLMEAIPDAGLRTEGGSLREEIMSTAGSWAAA